MRMPTADGDTLTYVLVTDNAWVPSATELNGLAGRYRSDEIGVTFTLAVLDGKLTLSPRTGVVSKLTPTYTDAFDANGDNVWFTRDTRGRVTAMHFGSARVWDFVSRRVEK